MPSRKLKVFSIFGTRPEAVKMGPVVLELQQRPDLIEHSLVVTGQHRDMLDQMLRLFGLTPDFDLDIMKPRQSLTSVAVATLLGLEKVFAEREADVVLVHGDTSTSFVAALAAYYARVAVGHVEAGLRTGDKYNPFPEEMNRVLIDGLCDAYFAPTKASRDQLLKEDKRAAGIFVTGNTVIDALLFAASKPEPEGLIPDVPADARVLLVEAHRRESWGDPMAAICDALLDLSARFPDVHVVFPVHLNPNVRDTVMPKLEGRPRIHLLPPQDYLPFVFLMRRAAIILTDSGGIQEEAPSLRRPVLVLRTKTERPEAVAARTAALVGTDRALIVETASRLLEDPAEYAAASHGVNPYGDGQAARRTVDALLHHFGYLEKRPEDFRTEI
jgi:UDP-N-acetylglucosamine 2-epimerase (non-hydrolysing)